MALWNQKCLPAPPTNTYKSNTTDLDLVKLRNVLQDCMRHFKNEDFMTREAALLSRILYRMKMKFRSAKEFKSLEKISHSLKIYLNANMSRDLKNILDLIPSKYQTVTYLPTRNMLSYILVRIQGLVKLMERMYDTCQVAASEINTRLFLGHFWRHYVILFALVSRLYILVKFNTKNLCELYGKLLPHVNKLKNVGRNWLPEGYILPSDLREWLEVKWVYEEEFIDLTQDLTLHPSIQILDFFNLVDDDDDEVQFCDEYVLIDEEDLNIAKDFRRLKPIEETLTRNRMRGFSINEDDIGEDIADIINLNETSMDNIDLIDIENNEQINSDVSDTNQTFDVIDDIGEDISFTINEKGEQTIINLDETSDCQLTEDRIITKSINEVAQSARTFISKSKSSMEQNKRNKISTDSVINLVDDSMNIEDEIIVIPETPVTNVQHNLNDHSVIVLNDTVENILGLSSKPKTTNIFGINLLNLSQELSKSSRKKNKGKSKHEKKSFSENVTDKRNKSISSSLVTSSQTSMESNNPTSQSPSSQEKEQTEETNGKRKISESSYPNENDSAAKKRKPDKEEISVDKTSNTDKSLINQEKPLKQLNGESTPPHHGINRGTDENHEETEEINQSTRNATNSPNSFNCVTPVKGEMITDDNTVQLLVDKGKKGKNNKQSNEHNDTIKLQQEREKISPSPRNITSSQDSLNSITPITEKIKTVETTVELGTKRKKDKKNNRHNKIKRKERISPSGNNITEFEKQDKNDSMITPGINKPKTKKRKKMKPKNLYLVDPIDYEGDMSCNICLNRVSTVEPGAKNKSKAKKKNKANNSTSLTETNKDNSKWKQESIVRLTLVKETPNVTGDRNECVAPSSTKKSPKNINLVPCLNTPLNATLNIDSLIRVSTSGETLGQNKPQEMTQNKKLKDKGKKGKKRKFEESLSNISLKKSEKKKVSKEKVKKGKRKKSLFRLPETEKSMKKDMVKELSSPRSQEVSIEELRKDSKRKKVHLSRGVPRTGDSNNRYIEESPLAHEVRKPYERQGRDQWTNERLKESPSSSLVGMPKTVESDNPYNTNRDERSRSDGRISKFFRNPAERPLYERPGKRPIPTLKPKSVKKAKKKKKCSN